MTRVPFGSRSSPYVANRTVRQLIIDKRDRYPLAAQSAQKYLYMDDLASSYPSEDEAIEVSNQLIKSFEAGGFQLVKFSKLAAVKALQVISFARDLKKFGQGKLYLQFFKGNVGKSAGLEFRRPRFDST
ncbi:hypothetical protein EVAR_64971_1 [Eumeta japonica]|uniref:Reverse transcriptase domain-containing protein n=1 Tax=Eumeta variegata TaxID=151549 RepID=A0A4C1ZPH5_EUMVA|nr:hypothetical protein EVAR_64971_1 [Eumeta japonica]